MAARRAGSSAWASSGEEDVTMGILGDEGEPGVEAGSEEAACRQRATKESMKMLQTEERTNERDSRGELGDMGVVAGDGAESQDQEVRAQRCRRELGEEERRHRRRTCVIYYSNTRAVLTLCDSDGVRDSAWRTTARATTISTHRAWDRAGGGRPYLERLSLVMLRRCVC